MRKKKNSPDIDPNSLEWLLLLRFVLLLLSIGGGIPLWIDFSNTSWSDLQYNELPSRNANSSPAKNNLQNINLERKLKLFRKIRAIGRYLSFNVI